MDELSTFVMIIVANVVSRFVYDGLKLFFKDKD